MLHAVPEATSLRNYARSVTNGKGADRAIVTVGVVVAQGVAPDSETSIPLSPLELTRCRSARRVGG